MHQHDSHKGSEKSGCKNCGNCRKSGCGSIAAAMKLDVAMDAAVSGSAATLDGSAAQLHPAE